MTVRVTSPDLSVICAMNEQLSFCAHSRRSPDVLDRLLLCLGASNYGSALRHFVTIASVSRNMHVFSFCQGYSPCWHNESGLVPGSDYSLIISWSSGRLIESTAQASEPDTYYPCLQRHPAP